MAAAEMEDGRGRKLWLFVSIICLMWVVVAVLTQIMRPAMVEYVAITILELAVFTAIAGAVFDRSMRPQDRLKSLALSVGLMEGLWVLGVGVARVWT